MKFTKFITEFAQAKKNDWKDASNMLGSISKTVIGLQYKKIDTVSVKGKTYELLLNTKDKQHLYYILGAFVSKSIETKAGKELEERFEIEFGITFSKANKSKTYGQLYNVDGVGVKQQGKGFSKIMYKYFTKKLKYTILGDSEQYFGARKLWARLSKELDVQVDLYNVKTDEVIEKNVILHHGNYNNDFDEKLWSFSKSKIHIRSILIDLI